MYKYIKDLFQSFFDVKKSEDPAASIGKDTAQEEQVTFDKESFDSEDVRVYALSTCIHCKNAKRYLDKCGVKYNCVYVDELTGGDRKEIVQEIKEHNPSLSFPVIMIKETVLVGYNKDELAAVLEKEWKE
ncbi:glutaredoxin family protein [Desulfovibrio sp. JC010]|uniref:glutaredoxin family protein n=1 Tax=Desulfovibrio sp. JC010 TaxID=2593641 RepID=UPI0013D02A9A|nr:glutaredoxin family protein [Desulfovibrio sp. JC010]NDV28070.1 glutaredoxin family protein [Desulfovibrio sp. JC010]